MANTQRSQTDLLSNLFQDGQSAGISANDVRDLIVSFAPDYMGTSFTTPAGTTISVGGTYVKAAGTTTVTHKSTSMLDDSVSNRLKYNGTATRHFHIVLQASVTLVSGNNQDISIALYKYDASAASGAIVAHSEAHNTVPGQNIVQLTSHADTMLDPGDYLEMHITNNTGTNAVQVDYGYVFAMSMIV